jgi:hypothetical protein
VRTEHLDLYLLDQLVLHLGFLQLLLVYDLDGQNEPREFIPGHINISKPALAKFPSHLKLFQRKRPILMIVLILLILLSKIHILLSFPLIPSIFPFGIILIEVVVFGGVDVFGWQIFIGVFLVGNVEDVLVG